MPHYVAQYQGLEQRSRLFLSTLSLCDVSRGGATVLKVGGTNSASEASRKFFFDPPLFGQWGDKILLTLR